MTRRSYLHEWDPSRYAPVYLRTGILEEIVQAEVIAVLRQLGVIAFAVDSGAKELRGRAAGALMQAGRHDLLARLKGRTGAGMTGLADVLGITPRGRFLAIECKRPALYVTSEFDEDRLVVKRGAGQPTEEQLEFLDAVHRSGGIAGVAWSSGDAVSIYEQATQEKAA